MQGQTQAVTAVMMTGIIVAGVVSVYVWGVPLVEKRQERAELESLESTIFEVENAIDRVSSNGKGFSNDIELEIENGDIKINSSADYIDIEAVAPEINYPLQWKLLRGENKQGLSIGSGDYAVKGEHEAGVVAVKRISETGSLVKYRIEYRNMNTSTATGYELRKVDLKASGALDAGGKSTLRLTNKGEARDEDFELSSGARIDRHRKIVEVELR